MYSLLLAKRIEKEMKVKPATSFKIIYHIYLQQKKNKTMCKTKKYT